MTGQLLNEGSLWFSVFTADINISETGEEDVGSDQVSAVVMEEQFGELQRDNLVTYFGQELGTEQREKFLSIQTVRHGDSGQSTVVPSDKYLNMALKYLYRKATHEIKEFHSGEKIEKIAVEREGVLLSSGRLLDEMNFQETADLPNLNLGSLGVKVNLPLIDRYSPLAYSVSQHIHWEVAKHRGIETCNRMSLENVTIMHGASLYKELAEECIPCKKKRKKHLQAAIGPISDTQLT